MTNLITELWYGNLHPSKISGSGNSEIKEIENLVSKSYHNLESLLDEKQLKFFEQYAENMNENLCLAEEQAFFDGFSLGTRLVAEALINSENT